MACSSYAYNIIVHCQLELTYPANWYQRFDWVHSAYSTHSPRTPGFIKMVLINILDKRPDIIIYVRRFCFSNSVYKLYVKLVRKTIRCRTNVWPDLFIKPQLSWMPPYNAYNGFFEFCLSGPHGTVLASVQVSCLVFGCLACIVCLWPRRGIHHNNVAKITAKCDLGLKSSIRIPLLINFQCCTAKWKWIIYIYI